MDVELILMDVAWRMGWQDWCQAGKCRHFRCGGYDGVGFGEFDSLKASVVYKVHKQDLFTDLFPVCEIDLVRATANGGFNGYDVMLYIHGIHRFIIIYTWTYKGLRQIC